MRISNSNDLGELLQKKFGGNLTVDEPDKIRITNMSETTQKEIRKEITSYYVETLKCTAYSQILGFENDKGYEVVALNYSPSQDKILITIIEMNKRQSTPQPSFQQTPFPSI